MTDRERLFAFLEAFSALPLVLAAKRRSFELVGAAPGRRLLDAGCGTGSDARALAELVAPDGEVVGVDAGATAIARARQAAAGRSHLRFDRADLAALLYEDDHFDGVRADRTVRHLPDPEAAVSELVRVTRPGGRVVLTEVLYGEPGRRTQQAPKGSGRKALLAFLPYLLHRAGVAEIAFERSADVIEAGPEILEVLGMRTSPIELHLVHIAGTVASRE